jgi:hypothetical protein
MLPMKRILIRILAILLTLSPAFILGYAVYTAVKDYYESPEYRSRYTAAKNKQIQYYEQKISDIKNGYDNGDAELYEKEMPHLRAEAEAGHSIPSTIQSSNPSAWDATEFIDSNTGELITVEHPPLTGWQSWQTWFLVAFTIVTIVNVNVAISFMIASVLLAIALAGLGVEMGMWFGTLVMGPILILFTIGALVGGEGSKQ